MSEIKLIICDFDGTLVDTREANYLAYRDVLKDIDYDLSLEKYNECFGLRFEEFMQRLGITDNDLMKKIRTGKAEIYPRYFDKIKINKNLVGFIKAFRESGGKTALASTSSRHNLLNVLNYKGLNNLFDAVISGDEVVKSKPDPECYIKAMKMFNVQPDEYLIFEDAPVGIAAATASGASYIIVKEAFDEN